ncbi:MAG: large conductance mechanosensitive channel protein MscL [Mycobacteriaceae bacterium]|nr:large conductance mechanosensitive channel protein MscL [Mycobacteriaceae bacterium]
MLKGFRDFLMRGNVIDLAVAVVMGTAFTQVVTAVTKSIIQPLINLLSAPGSREGWGFHLNSAKPDTFIDLSQILTALINFAAIAAVLYFVLVLPMKTAQRRRGVEKESKTENELLTEIRDALTSGRA